MPKIWIHWKYKYLTLLIVGLIVSAYLLKDQNFHRWLESLGNWEYLGAFVAGLLFSSSLTVPTSMVVIALLAKDINPFILALIGGIGAYFADYLIYKFVENDLSSELSALIGADGRHYLKLIFHSKYVAWTLPVLGALIIASPLPDELGVGLLGMSHISQKKLALISYPMNTIGILIIALVAKYI